MAEVPLGVRLHRIHIHLSAEEVGAPNIALAPKEGSNYAEGRFEVDDDRIEQIARARFARDGWTVVENAQFDIDIAYDGQTYLVEAWVL